MEFKKLVIENFRNFSSIEIDLSNKNVISGMNENERFGKNKSFICNKIFVR